jgi:DNA-binding transcriptional regulator YbjK
MSRSALRRAAIVEATLRVIDAGGAASVTHRAVATAAGVPLAATTYYFTSKDALLREALELVIERSVALVDEIADVPSPLARDELSERLLRLALAQLGSFDAPVVAQYELLLEASRDDALAALAARWTASYNAALERLVAAAGVSAPAQAAAVLALLLEGTVLTFLGTGAATAETAIRPLLGRVVQGL